MCDADDKHTAVSSYDLRLEESREIVSLPQGSFNIRNRRFKCCRRTSLTRNGIRLVECWVHRDFQRRFKVMRLNTILLMFLLSLS